jgi:hypothetical protein
MGNHNSKPAGRDIDNSSSTWIAETQARGLDGALDLALGALEPLGPLGAQLLYIAQPVLGLFGWKRAVTDIAQALETPGGIEALRQDLRDPQADPADDPVG